MRRSVEFLIACVLLALTSPLMLAWRCQLKGESSGPVLERQQRIGNGGRRFQMLWFRTAGQQPGQLRSTWQTTQFGHFLRSTRIDALPQLFNVLRGEMSIMDTSLFD